MAAPARIERALTSSGVNPTWGMMIVVAAQSAAVISALLIIDHFFSFENRCNMLVWGRAGLS